MSNQVIGYTSGVYDLFHIITDDVWCAGSYYKDNLRSVGSVGILYCLLELFLTAINNIGLSQV